MKNKHTCRVNKCGYVQCKKSGKWQFVHRLRGEEKIGRKLLPSEEVHHIDKIRGDNRSKNLVVMVRGVHRHLHESKWNEKNDCFRCGRPGHRAKNCYARTKYDGYPIYH